MISLKIPATQFLQVLSAEVDGIPVTGLLIIGAQVGSLDIRSTQFLCDLTDHCHNIVAGRLIFLYPLVTKAAADKG